MPAQLVDRKFAIHGGEDYELLFTAPRGRQIPRRIAGVTIAQIGHITRPKRIFVIDGKRRSVLYPQGWEHFR
jgi:thiamine-monophosphate kinase